jgi:hypothetical protein
MHKHDNWIINVKLTKLNSLLVDGNFFFLNLNVHSCKNHISRNVHIIIIILRYCCKNY